LLFLLAVPCGLIPFRTAEDSAEVFVSGQIEPHPGDIEATRDKTFPPENGLAAC